jgi:hypothetical protein
MPANPSNDTSVSFSFTSTEEGSVFECQLDGGSYAACASPMDYTGLAEGNHTFSVRAKDGAGNTDPTPASYIWTTIITHTITASAGVNGTISPSGEVTVNHGANQTFTITPGSGYYIAEVTVDGISVGAVSSYDFSNITEDHIITAVFMSSVKIQETGVYYPSLQAAYNAASSGATIKCQAVTLYENVNLNRSITVTIDGGYDSTYTTRTGTTGLHGSMNLTGGIATLKNFVLQN